MLRDATYMKYSSKSETKEVKLLTEDWVWEGGVCVCMWGHLEGQCCERKGSEDRPQECEPMKLLECIMESG